MFAPGFAAQISSIYAQVGRTLGAPSCPLLAQSGHPNSVKQCPLLGVKRTSAYLLADIYAGPTSPTPKKEAPAPAEASRVFWPYGMIHRLCVPRRTRI